MNGLLLILAVLLPIVAGIASYVLPLSEKTRRIFCSCAIFATTIIGWLAILTCSEEKVVLFSFTDNLIFSLRMDGAADAVTLTLVHILLHSWTVANFTTIFESTRRAVVAC